MSHFTVAVIHSPEESVEDILAPYQENNMGDCPREYMEFFDAEEENRDEYDNGEVEKIVSPSGDLFNVWSKEVEEYKNPDWKNDSDASVPRFNLPEGWEFKKVPFKTIYPTFEQYLEDWHSFQKDEETGKYGYWENPDARWDWYQIGGRWSESLLLKEGATPFMEGEESWMIRMHPEAKSEKEGNWCDSAVISQVDWEGMDRINREKAEKNYDEAMQYLSDHEGEEKILTELYWRFGVENKDGVVQTKEEYVANSGSFSTYSVLMDGEWNEAGKMGWWGISHADDKDRDSWSKSYPALIQRLREDRPNDVITIVDCHI